MPWTLLRQYALPVRIPHVALPTSASDDAILRANLPLGATFHNRIARLRTGTSTLGKHLVRPVTPNPRLFLRRIPRPVPVPSTPVRWNALAVAIAHEALPADATPHADIRTNPVRIPLQDGVTGGRTRAATLGEHLVARAACWKNRKRSARCEFGTTFSHSSYVAWSEEEWPRLGQACRKAADRPRSVSLCGRNLA